MASERKRGAGPAQRPPPTAPRPGSRNRGFASMDPERQPEAGMPGDVNAPQPAAPQDARTGPRPARPKRRRGADQDDGGGSS